LLVAATTSLKSFNVGKHAAYVRHGGPTLIQRASGHGFVVSIATDIYMPPRIKVCPLKAGDILLVDPPDAKINENIEFRFEVAFNEPGVSEGDPILETLHHFFDLVLNISNSFAAL
jgi:hypothetical protein